MAVVDRSDVRRVVDKIRRVMEGLDRPEDQELQRLHSRYCEYIGGVNEELEACEVLIDRHDESAAVQRSERSKVLELVTTLSFPDRLAWENYLAEQQFSLPDPLRVSSAGRLSRCYGPARQREPLLRELRWHALANSPLRVRLEIMRRMQRLDPESDVCAADIREFESARLEQIATELQQANESGDVRRLEVLSRELASKEWREKPDKDLINEAQLCFKQHRAREARRQIPPLLESLRNAESAGLDRIEDGRRWRSQLLGLLEQAALPAESETRMQIQEAVRWVEAIDQRDASRQERLQLLGELEQALDVSHPQRDRLRSLQYHLSRFDEPIPAALEMRLNSTFADLEATDRRGHVRKIFGILTLVGTAAAIVFYVLHDRADQSVLAAHEQRLRMLIERKDFEAINSYVEKLKQQSPQSLDAPQIAALMAQAEHDQADELDRQRKVQTGLEEARTELSQATELSSVTQVVKRLTELAALSRTDDETHAVEAAQRLADETRAKIQTRLDEQFAADLKDLSDRYAKIPPADVDALGELQTQLRRLHDRPDVTESMRTPVVALQTRIATQMNSEVAEREQQRLADAITKAVGDRGKYQALLGDFVEHFPQSARGLMFSRVLKDEAELWAKVEEQNQFVQTNSSLDLAALTPTQAGEVLQQARDFIGKNPGFGKKDSVQKLIEVLGPIAARAGEAGGRIEDSLVEVLRDPTITGLFMVLTKEGKRYYSDEPPKGIGGGTWQVRCFRDGSLTAKVNRTFTATGLELHEVGGMLDWTAPQTAFAKESVAQLARITDSAWEETLLAILGRLHADTRMDPILKFQLLDAFLPVVSRGSQPLQAAYAGTIKQMKLLRLGGNLNLFDPDDVDTAKARLQAADFVKSLPDPAKLAAEIAKARARAGQLDLGGMNRWVGWIVRQTNRWECVAPIPPGNDVTGGLFIVQKAEGGIELTPIGAARNGEYVIETTSSLLLVAGRPVFLAVPREKPSN